MKTIHCPKDIGFENTFDGRDCELEQYYNNCYHCWTSAIAKNNQEYFKRKLVNYDMSKTIQTEWKVTYDDGSTEELSDDLTVELVAAYLDDSKFVLKIERIAQDKT